MSAQVATPWDGHYMLPAFLDCVRWGLRQPDVLLAFRIKTGNRYAPPKSGIEAMIDRATGADREFVQQFIDFVASDVFGVPADLESQR